MSDGFFNFNRPRRQIEPSIPDERDRDLGGIQPHTPDQSATDRRDPGADALLELARLIGQTDPLAPVSGRSDEVHKSDGRLVNVSANALRAAASPTAGAKDPFTRPPGREPTQSHDRSRDDRSYQNPSYHDQSYDDRLADDRFRQHQPFEGRSSEARSSLDRGVPVRRDPDFSLPRVPVQPTHPDTDHSETSHTAESYDFLQLPGRGDYPVAPRQALADEGDYDHGDHHESPMTARRYPVYGQQHEEYADEYHEDGYGQDGDHEYDTEHDNPEDGEPGVKRRRSTKVVIAVLGLAVFGSAAALGYRTIFKAAPSDPTPIIRADKSPTKITPTGTDANAKLANGRFGDSAEQLVRRDEEPVDVGSSPFRSGAVDAAGRLPNTAGSSQPEIAPATVGPAPPGDTKRVRTVTIRADQGAAASDRTPSRALPPPQSQPPLPRQAAASPAPIPSSAPVAIAPEAAVPRAVEAGGGGFVVQLSAQRSEAEAQAAFRTLQAKYSVLSGRQALIRRKDQGEKGVFYAAQVGPFGTRADAVQLCETLKATGGSCYIPKD